MSGRSAPSGHPSDQVDQRATRAVIDLDALHRNLEILRAHLRPGTAMMAVVKANAYGHGAMMVAQTALAAGVVSLGVATVQEGRQLRGHGISAPILVLSPVTATEAPIAVAHDLQLVIGTAELLEAVLQAAGSAATRVGLHVKVDTGMHRYGAEPDLAIALAKRVAAAPSVRLAGLMTHFAAADEPQAAFTATQADAFDHCVTTLAAHGIQPEVRHLANSAAALRETRFHGDLVRFGIAMYGLRPSPSIPLPAGITPVMSVHSTVGRVHRADPPATVGYGRTYSPATAEHLALIPIGYADGYRRGLSNQAWMAIGSSRLNVVGRVSMDQTVVRVAVGASVKPGDAVAVFGGSDGTSPSVDQLADLLGTISYEIVTGVAARVPRHYVRGGQVIAVESLSLG